MTGLHFGTANPTQLLTLGAPEGTRLEIASTSPLFPWLPSTGDVDPGSFVINLQVQGSSQPNADFGLQRDRAGTLATGFAIIPQSMAKPPE